MDQTEEIIKAYLIAPSAAGAYQLFREHQEVFLSRQVRTMLQNKIAQSYRLGENGTAKRLEMHLRLFDIARIRGIDAAWHRFASRLIFVQFPDKEETTRQYLQRVKDLAPIMQQFLEMTTPSLLMGYPFIKTHRELLSNEAAFTLTNWIAMAQVMEDHLASRQLENIRLLLHHCRENGIEEAFAEAVDIPVDVLRKHAASVEMPVELQEIIAELMKLTAGEFSEENWLQSLDTYPELRQRFLIAQFLRDLDTPVSLEVRKLLRRPLLLEHHIQWHPDTTVTAAELSKSWKELYQSVPFTQFSPAIRAKMIDHMAIACKLEGKFDAALEFWEEAKKLASPETLLWYEILNNMSECLDLRYQRSHSWEDLEALLNHDQAAVDMAFSDSSMFPALLNNLGLALSEHYDQRDEVLDLEEAIYCFETALHHTALSDRIHRVNYLKNLGSRLLDRFEISKQSNDLERAFASFTESADLISPDDPTRAESHLNLGNAFLARFQHQKDEQDLELVIQHCQKAVDLCSTESTDLPMYLNGFGNAFIARYHQNGKRKDLEQAIDLYQRAVDLTHKEPDPVYLGNLYRSLSEHYDLTGETASLSKALQLANNVVKTRFSSSPKHLQDLRNLADLYNDTFMRFGRMEDLHLAILYTRFVLQNLSSKAPTRFINCHDLGCMLENRFKRLNDIHDLDEAIAFQREALDLVELDSPNWPIVQAQLGAFLRKKYDYNPKNGLDVLEEAITMIVPALEQIPRDAAYFWTIQMNLGNALRSRYEASENLEDLQLAVRYFQEAVRETPSGTPNKPMSWGNLAMGLKCRYIAHQLPEDLQSAIYAYEQACEEGKLVAPDVVLDAAYQWGNWATERESWDEAVHAYAYAVQAMEGLHQEQLLQTNQNQLLFGRRRLNARAAYALAQAGNLREAVRVLEQGRARNLSNSLARDRANMQRLQNIDAELYQRYQEVASQLKQFEQNEREISHISALPEQPLAETTSLAEQIRLARKELDLIIAAIRTLLNDDEFLADPAFEQIQVSVGPIPLVYCLTTDAGGLALILHPNHPDTILPVWLPDLKEEALTEILYNGISSPISNYWWGEPDEFIRNLGASYAVPPYMRTYFGAKVIGKDPEGDPNKWHEKLQNDWQDALDRMTHWLWKVLMGPLVAALIPAKHITIIPTGMLGLLPLHAAWKEDQALPSGRHYVVDDMMISYAPNARVLAFARNIAEHTMADSLLAVDEPQHESLVAAPLPFSQGEVQAACAAFPSYQILRHDEATREAVLEALPTRSVWHCSSHGTTDFFDSLNSCLVMSNNVALTLRDLFALHVKGLRLAVLSACETGMLNSQLPDETIGLPSGLLQAGVAGVIASLWAANEVSTLFLMIRFYELWRKEEIEASEALRQAQIWVRDTTPNQKIAYFDRFLVPGTDNLVSPVLAGKIILLLYTSALDTTHPYYWAAFTYTGA